MTTQAMCQQSDVYAMESLGGRKQVLSDICSKQFRRFRKPDKSLKCQAGKAALVDGEGNEVLHNDNDNHNRIERNKDTDRINGNENDNYNNINSN